MARSGVIHADRTGCPLCGHVGHTLVDSQSDLFFGSPEEFGVARCAACDALFTIPQLSVEQLRAYYPDDYRAFSDNLSSSLPDTGAPISTYARVSTLYGRLLYDAIWATGPRRVAARSAACLLRLGALIYGAHPPDLIPIPPNSRSYLHVGSGTGGRFLRLKVRGWNVSAVDINRDLLRRWVEAGVLTDARYAGIEYADFDEGRFDVVFMSHVLEHLTTPIACLEKIRTWLKPQGILVCELPVYETFGWNARRGFTYYDVPRHVVHYTDRTLIRTLSQAGLSVRLRTVLPNPWGFFFCDFKRCVMTGKPRDCSYPHVSETLFRHRTLGWIAWLARSSGNVCVYAVRD